MGEKILNNKIIAGILVIVFIVSVAFAAKRLLSHNRLSKKDRLEIEKINRIAQEEMERMAEN